MICIDQSFICVGFYMKEKQNYDKLGGNDAIIANFCMLFALPYVIWFSLISRWLIDRTKTSVGKHRLTINWLLSTFAWHVVPAEYANSLSFGCHEIWLWCQLHCILLFTCRIDNLVQMSRWNHRMLLCHLDQVSDNY